MVQAKLLATYITLLPAVAAISGPSPADGCLLTLACDSHLLVQGAWRRLGNECTSTFGEHINGLVVWQNVAWWRAGGVV